MTTAVLIPQAPVAETRSLFADGTPEPPRRTLEAAVLSTLDERRLRGTTVCLVCGEQMGGSGPCESCGSVLS